MLTEYGPAKLYGNWTIFQLCIQYITVCRPVTGLGSYVFGTGSYVFGTGSSVLPTRYRLNLKCRRFSFAFLTQSYISVLFSVIISATALGLHYKRKLPPRFYRYRYFLKNNEKTLSDTVSVGTGNAWDPRTQWELNHLLVTVLCSIGLPSPMWTTFC